jgi:hypothetical protein
MVWVWNMFDVLIAIERVGSRLTWVGCGGVFAPFLKRSGLTTLSIILLISHRKGQSEYDDSLKYQVEINIPGTVEATSERVAYSSIPGIDSLAEFESNS